MKFDSTVLDTAIKFIEFLILIGGGLALVYKFGRIAERVEQVFKKQNADIDELKEETKQVTKLLTEMAVQGHRLDRLEEDIHDLRRGKGWINPLTSD